jgi:hypothetical protein
MQADELANAVHTLREVAIFVHAVSHELSKDRLKDGADVSEFAAKVREIPRVLQGRRIIYDAREHEHTHDVFPPDAVVVSVPAAAANRDLPLGDFTWCFHIPYTSLQVCVKCVRDKNFCFVYYAPYVDPNYPIG